MVKRYNADMASIIAIRTTRVVASWICLTLFGFIGLASSLTVKGQAFPSLINATLDDLSSGLADGLFTSVDLVEAYLARIHEVNDTLRAVTELNPDALAIAAELDAARANGISYGALHGIPILVKNNIATGDSMENTAGSWSLVGAKVPRDSFVAKKLRCAGAIILGKTNLSQWANYRSENTSNGWSAHGGQTLGAYYPHQDPGGSSSGSGVASSLGLALAALGTETIGSIISPAESNNLVGIKPTVGLTSRHLVIPISEHHDTVGPLARTVKDAATILTAIAGVDTQDNYTSAIPNCGVIPNYAADLQADALRGARIGIPYNILPPTNDTPLNTFYAAVDIMREQGAEIIAANVSDPTAPKDFSIMQADFVANLAEYLSELTHNPHNLTTLSAVRSFTRNFPTEAYPDRDTAIWDVALELNYTNTDAFFWDTLQRNRYAGGEAGVLGAMQRNDVDALIMPSAYASGWASLVGAPIVTVPLGFYPTDTPVSKTPRGQVLSGPNIPFGLAFLGPRWSEARLIQLAYAFEQKTAVRDQVQPYLVPKTEIGDIGGF
ncbi:amidase signature enzyme [Poronia punctata]|nr:amidase signature enzyme [Poronia punctata]